MLVVDGLSYCYYGELKRIFGITGSFLFSTLPTITAINKRRILSGLLDLDDSYESIMNKLYSEFRWKITDSDHQNLEHFLLEDQDLLKLRDRKLWELALCVKTHNLNRNGNRSLKKMAMDQET